MTRVYYDTEVEAHDAAREQSKTSACGLFVRDDMRGFFVSPFGEPGTSCYWNGALLVDLEDDVQDNAVEGG